jgi:hypothetical protein
MWKCFVNKNISKNLFTNLYMKFQNNFFSCDFFLKTWTIINIKWFSQFHCDDLQGKFNNLYQTIMHDEMSMIPFSMKILVLNI